MQVPKITQVWLLTIISIIFLHGCVEEKQTNAVEIPKIVKTMVVGEALDAKPRHYPGTVKANKSVESVCFDVLERTCEAVNLVLDTAESLALVEV